MKTLHLTLILAVGMIILSGCSETKDTAPVVQTAVSVHGVGFKDPSSSNFHAKYIQSKNYDLTLCQSCHGGDFAGGTTGQSCNTCHTKPGGPENCTTCHGSVNAAPPNDLLGNSATSNRGVGAHQKHLLGGMIGASVPCGTCHVVPSTVNAAGHLDGTTHAEVRFDSTVAAYRSGAAYSTANATCSNTYCHGNFNGGNGNVTMAWKGTGGATSTACGTCHGDATKSTLKEKAFPASGHTAASVTSDCSTCHSRTVNASLTIIDPTNHMNGQVD